MSWPTKLAYTLGLKSTPDPLVGFTGPTAKKRIRDILARNPAIGGDLKIVDALLINGKMKGYLLDEKIIRQNDQDDDVFFLLAGEANIIVDGQKRTIRSAPNQVGEMAAIEPGKPRAATVQVRSRTACAWRVSGSDFMSIWRSNPAFKERLHIEMASRHREQIDARKIAEENNSNSFIWFLISVSAALVAALIGWFGLETTGWTAAARSISATGIALAVFVFMLLQNPTFFWRRSIAFLLWLFAGKFIYDTGFSIEAQQGFGSLQVSFQPTGTPVDWVSTLATTSLILVAMGMCMLMEHLQSKRP